jgi:hypothetical protein
MKRKRQNKFIACAPNIARCMRFWKSNNQTSANDRAGNFNLKLYLDYLTIINEGVYSPVNQ